MKRLGLWIGLAFAALFGLFVYLTLFGNKHRVEVCMAFHGRAKCASAAAKTAAAAQRTATSLACSDIASGMTDSIACENTPPQSVRTLE